MHMNVPLNAPSSHAALTLFRRPGAWPSTRARGRDPILAVFAAACLVVAAWSSTAAAGADTIATAKQAITRSDWPGLVHALDDPHVRDGDTLPLSAELSAIPGTDFDRAADSIEAVASPLPTSSPGRRAAMEILARAWMLRAMQLPSDSRAAALTRSRAALTEAARLGSGAASLELGLTSSATDAAGSQRHFAEAVENASASLEVRLTAFRELAERATTSDALKRTLALAPGLREPVEQANEVSNRSTFTSAVALLEGRSQNWKAACASLVSLVELGVCRPPLGAAKLDDDLVHQIGAHTNCTAADQYARWQTTCAAASTAKP